MPKSAHIVTVPHPALRQRADVVQELDKKKRTTLETLATTLLATQNPPGVGLAAPQIAQTLRAFATNLNAGEEGPPHLRLFINPEIIDQSERVVVGVNPRDPDLEGCLSIPSLYGIVARPDWVTLRFQTLQPSGELSAWHTETFFDFAGRVMQHELDHLNGVLFTDHVRTQNGRLFQQQGDRLEEVDLSLALAL